MTGSLPTSPWLNGVLFVVTAGAHVAIVASGTFPLEHRFRHWRVELTGDETVGESA